jgi:hypothetical protein
MTDYIKKAFDFLRVRRQAYVKVFHGVYADVVLKDLAKFCRAHESTFHPDPHVRCQLEGRREVWLRLQHHLQLTDEQMWELYGQKTK